MAIKRFTPVNDLHDMQRNLNRVFNSFFDDDVMESRGSWIPNVDVKETSETIVISADLPGLRKDDIKITIQDRILQISGEKKQPDVEEGANFHRVERVFGSFCRQFNLPTTVKNNAISAVFKDGVLELTLPKADEAKGREIEIK